MCHERTPVDVRDITLSVETKVIAKLASDDFDSSDTRVVHRDGICIDMRYWCKWGKGTDILLRQCTEVALGHLNFSKQGIAVGDQDFFRHRVYVWDGQLHGQEIEILLSQ